MEHLAKIRNFIFTLIATYIMMACCSCDNSIHRQTGCEYRHNLFILPFAYTGGVEGNLIQYESDGSFSNIKSKKTFYDYCDTKRLERKTILKIDSLSFCNDFILELLINGDTSRHYFSEIEFEKTRKGRIEVVFVQKYCYNGKIYENDSCNFSLIIPDAENL